MINSLQSLPSKYQIKSELVRRKKHIFPFQKKQIVFADIVNIFEPSDKKRVLVYGGAMGGGKTYICVSLAIEAAMYYPNSIWTILRQSRVRCEETVVKDFKSIAKGLYKGFNEQKLIAYFENGSSIEFKGENLDKDPDLDAFKSYATNGFFIEQIEEIQKKTLEMCLLRTGRHRITPMPPQIVMASVNPSFTWVKQDIYIPYLNNTLPENIYYVPALIQDNKYLFDDPAYMSTFQNLDPLTRERYLEGNWDAFGVDKPFMYCFDDKKHISKTIQLNEKDTVYLSFDFNVDPITCIVAQLDHNFIHILDEFRLRNSNLYDLSAAILSKYGQRHFIITGDASGLSRHVTNKGNVNNYSILLRELGLSERQLKIPSVNPPINESRTLSNSIFARHPNVLIHEQCKFLIEDNKYVQVKEDGSIDKSSNVHRGHLLDCERYLFNSFKGNFIIKK